MTRFFAEVHQELTRRILPFWSGLRDDVRGGYVGKVDYDLIRHPEADKGCILNSRILWFFSEAYLLLKDEALLGEARHAYEMLKRMTDQQNGGVYWSLHADGTVADATKHTYNQAFAIYALSAYFRAGKNPYALERAKVLFRMIEDKCRDAGGYLEAFTADWRPESNEKLSENGVMATRTMNTLLHVMEGYTGLYQVWSDPELKARLYEILDIWESKIYNKEKRRQEVFFDHEYHSLIDLHSFGHDIETSWLTEKTLEALDDPALTARIRPRLLEMADHTWHAAFTDHGFANECERGVVNQKRIWWVQAEALMGFLNAWEKTGETRYWDAMLSQWNYIRDVMTDKRTNSEWFWYVNEDGTPGSDEPIVEPWKCPYHNGRMCIEVLRRGMKEEAK
ncbi:MAG: AGE family epimerase/isomerase [Clostridia bacterium]|nr:AGE family epimerase/isomerase [Clostridia bacterium]